VCSRKFLVGVTDNASLTEASVKLGFHWLRKQIAVDDVVVDDKTNASFLEHLVFKYDLLDEYFSL